MIFTTLFRQCRASLVQEDFNSAFRTINDIKNCRISPGDVCMPRGGAVEAYWKSAIAPKYVVPMQNIAEKWDLTAEQICLTTNSLTCCASYALPERAMAKKGKKDQNLLDRTAKSCEWQH